MFIVEQNGGKLTVRVNAQNLVSESIWGHLNFKKISWGACPQHPLRLAAFSGSGSLHLATSPLIFLPVRMLQEIEVFPATSRLQAAKYPSQWSVAPSSNEEDYQAQKEVQSSCFIKWQATRQLKRANLSLTIAWERCHSKGVSNGVL